MCLNADELASAPEDAREDEEADLSCLPAYLPVLFYFVPWVLCTLQTPTAMSSCPYFAEGYGSLSEDFNCKEVCVHAQHIKQTQSQALSSLGQFRQ